MQETMLITAAKYNMDNRYQMLFLPKYIGQVLPLKFPFWFISPSQLPGFRAQATFLFSGRAPPQLISPIWNLNDHNSEIPTENKASSFL